MKAPAQFAFPAVRLNRREALRAGVCAAFWRVGPPAAAQAEAAPKAADGFWLLESGPAQAQLQAAPGGPTQALGYNSRTPGPLIRLRLGEALKVRLANGLNEPTTIGWPGLRMANAAAGIGGLTQAALAPGGKADISFTPPDAGFNLYRPHAGAATPGQIARGLCGPIIVEEASPPSVDRDLVAILSDWRLDGDGQFKDDLADPAIARGAGRLGALVSANGAATPLNEMLAPGARVRLRLANAANARIMAIAIDGMKPHIIAIDGQPCELFAPLQNWFPMGPGARFELMVDMPREPGAVRFVLKGALPGEADRTVILLNGEGAAAPPRAAFDGLPANPHLPSEIDLARATRIDLTIAGGGATPFTLNGAVNLDWPAKPLFTVARRAPVTLGFTNKTPYAQAMRLHGHCMRLLHPKDDGWEPYWRDVALIGPGQTVHAAFVADNPGKWPLESAIPEHQAAGLKSWFEVT